MNNEELEVLDIDDNKVEELKVNEDTNSFSIIKPLKRTTNRDD